MSTKLEDLVETQSYTDFDEKSHIEFDENDLEFDENDLELENISTESIGNHEPGPKPKNKDELNKKIAQILYEKLKEPVVVSLIMLFLTHPYLIQGIFRIPNIEIMEKTISVNVILSLLAGILFFLVKEFII
jgi:hypothetical protein